MLTWHITLGSKLAKVLASLALVGAAGSVAGLGTFATFTSSTSASNGVASGTVAIALGAVGPANRLTVGATGLVPGDTLQRVVQLANTGSQDLVSVGLTTTASPSSLLDTDVASGLKIAIDRCSVEWTETGPPYTYTCSGTTSSVLGQRAVIGANMALSNLASLSAGTTDHLRVTLTLSPQAPNTMQGLSSSITYTFTGTQRVGTAK
jgi:predicted ribosomally synthesized peptide with SipW-like signal peptide